MQQHYTGIPNVEMFLNKHKYKHTVQSNDSAFVSIFSVTYVLRDKLLGCLWFARDIWRYRNVFWL